MMVLFNPRAVVPFVQGANSSDVQINGDHFNRTTLNFWNYTLYDNGTLSNGSHCYLALPNLHPVLLSNGTILNGTWCYDPYNSIGQRGSLGIVCACFFAVSIMFTLVNLRKHGKLFLPAQTRFHPIGRRWQWYWMLFVAACGLIGCISAIDVDRDYLQSVAIIVQNFFFYLMIPGTLAAVWEGVRHWGSWQERQLYDQEPFTLRQGDRRSQKEFWMPLVFYLCAWLNFFMIIPRNWGSFSSQSDPQQSDTIAKPSATDTRFKAAAFFAFLAWFIIFYSLKHSIHYYRPKNRGCVNSCIGFFRQAPFQFLFTIPLSLVVTGYACASAFSWDVNPAKYNVNGGWLYGLGYAPVILILAVNEAAGLMKPNEDRDLLRQRVQRGRNIDTELGIQSKRKPWYWRSASQPGRSTDARLKALTTEIGGGRTTSRNLERAVELGVIPVRPHEDDEHVDPFRDPEEPSPQTPYKDAVLQRGFSRDNDGSDGRVVSESGASAVASRPQPVRSMLDV